ncbi:scamp-domain-containing protein [Atractiella rhizophila]|nr:scamp-domain-containing protein [Atractiella rhizophila]
MTSDNPFADHHQPSASDNPFADPTIQGALGSTKSTYNDVGGGYSSDTLDQKSQAGTGYTTVELGVAGRTDDTAARLAEIRRREEELERRERNLGDREDHMKKHGRNNWPFFYPLIYHDIDAEIPSDSRSTVLTLYRVWQFLLIVLIANLVGAILLLTSGQRDGGADLGSAVSYCIFIPPSSFLLWYRPFYNGYMKEMALYYYFFFVFGGFHVLYCAYMVVGIPSTGSAGLINTLRAFGDGSIVTGVFGVIATAGWAAEGLGILWIYRAAYARHNEKGHTFAQAKSDLQSQGLRAYFSRNQ